MVMLTGTVTTTSPPLGIVHVPALLTPFTLTVNMSSWLEVGFGPKHMNFVNDCVTAITCWTLPSVAF